MKIDYQKDYEAVSREGASLLSDFIKENPTALIGFSSGASPRRMYEILADDPIIQQSSIRAIGLDEWIGIDPEHPSSCFYDLEQHVFIPWGIPEENRFIFDAAAKDPAMECERMAEILSREGPMDFCILGLGINGHLGLNEPDNSLNPNIHLAQLLETTRKHVMLKKGDIHPTHGLTLGMRDILRSREILLLACGPEKEEVVQALLAGGISTELPASFLRLHSRATIVVDEGLLQIA